MLRDLSAPNGDVADLQLKLENYSKQFDEFKDQ